MGGIGNILKPYFSGLLGIRQGGRRQTNGGRHGILKYTLHLKDSKKFVMAAVNHVLGGRRICQTMKNVRCQILEFEGSYAGH